MNQTTRMTKIRKDFLYQYFDLKAIFVNFNSGSILNQNGSDSTRSSILVLLS